MCLSPWNIIVSILPGFPEILANTKQRIGINMQGKVIFSQAYVKNSVHGGGGVCGRGACMAGGHAWQEKRQLQRAVRILPTGMHSCLLQYFYMKVARAWVTVTLTSYGSP